jgi:hypothetical protein
MKTGLIVFGVVAALVLSYAGCALSYRSTCIRAENGIKAQYEQNQNNYDNMWKKFKEMAQVPAMYADDLKKVYDSAIAGRYGAEGSKAAFQFIKEHNPNFSDTTYVKLQAAIESGRNGFEADQKQLIDKKREYENILGSTNAVFVGLFFGFPRIDLAKYAIVTSDVTQDAFTTKKADEVKLR